MSTPNPHSAELLAEWYSARALVAAEWAPAILMALLPRGLHYSQLREAVQACSVAEIWNPRHERLHQSTLTRTLKQLTADGLLTRDEVPGSFPRTVHYSLTPAARELIEATKPQARWVQHHHALVEHARRRRWEPDDDAHEDQYDLEDEKGDAPPSQ